MGKKLLTKMALQKSVLTNVNFSKKGKYYTLVLDANDIKSCDQKVLNDYLDYYFNISTNILGEKNTLGFSFGPKNDDIIDRIYHDDYEDFDELTALMRQYYRNSKQYFKFDTLKGMSYYTSTSAIEPDGVLETEISIDDTSSNTKFKYNTHREYNDKAEKIVSKNQFLNPKTINTMYLGTMFHELTHNDVQAATNAFLADERISLTDIFRVGYDLYSSLDFPDMRDDDVSVDKLIGYANIEEMEAYYRSNMKLEQLIDAGAITPDIHTKAIMCSEFSNRFTLNNLRKNFRTYVYRMKALAEHSQHPLLQKITDYFTPENCAKVLADAEDKFVAREQLFNKYCRDLTRALDDVDTDAIVSLIPNQARMGKEYVYRMADRIKQVSADSHDNIILMMGYYFSLRNEPNKTDEDVEIMENLAKNIQLYMDNRMREKLVAKDRRILAQRRKSQECEV